MQRGILYSLLGRLIFYLSNAMDWLLVSLRLQDKPRPLTREEKEVLKPIFGDSLKYDAIKITQGKVGLYGLTHKYGATAIGYHIYFRSYDSKFITLVHECVHVWQFQTTGTFYIGQSAVLQLLHKFGGDNPYDWVNTIGRRRNSWSLLKSAEAQAEFIERLYAKGKFIFEDGRVDSGAGAFFRNEGNGKNQFLYLKSGNRECTERTDGATDYTIIANEAWNRIRETK